jgi:protein-S-isoprenylcysteine O-methyltransferase Ste14
LTTVRYVLGVLLVVSLPPGIAWWFIVHPFVAFWRRVGMRWAFGVIIATMLACTAGLFLIRRPLLGADLGWHWPLFAAGAVLLVMAASLGMKRRRHLTFRILAGVPELEPDGRGGVLLTEGPYALIRHPRYVEVALGVVAYALMANFVGAYLVALATIPLLHVLVLLEERELSDRFGDAYAAYRARVPRYIPRSMSPTPQTDG